MYLNLNDAEYVHLPMLNSDSDGCYLSCIEIFNKCPGCGQRYFIRCTTPGCSLTQNKQEREREKERAKEQRQKEKKKK